MRKTVKTLWINEGKGFSIALFLLSAPSVRMFYEVDGTLCGTEGEHKSSPIRFEMASGRSMIL